MKAVKSLLLLLCMCSLLLVGCGGDKVDGKLTAKLEKSTIMDNETIDLRVNGKNTGDLVANLSVQISSEDDSLLLITYSGSLSETLQPGEELGTKIVKVQGFSKYTQTTLWIDVQLVDDTTGEIVDVQREFISIEK